MATDLGLDIDEIITKKIDANDKKYPVNKAKNKSTKYTQL